MKRSTSVYVSPTPELVTNRYEIREERKGSVYIFCTCLESPEIEEIVNIIKPVFSGINCEITEDKIRNLNSLNDVDDALIDIYDNITNETHNYLIIFFVGHWIKSKSCFVVGEDNLRIRHITNFFYERNATLLRDIPKVFVFQGFTEMCSPRLQMDCNNKKNVIAYNKPPEADLLVVFKLHSDFCYVKENLETICENVAKNFNRRDIISLLAYVKEWTPLLISTLTKKFYLTHGSKSGIELDIEHNMNAINKMVEQLDTKRKS